jgi:phosphatidylserine decarboxylase
MSERVFWSRAEKKYLPLRIVREQHLHWTYSTRTGRAVNQLTARPWFSHLYGVWADSRISARSIPAFARQFGIHEEEFAPAAHKTLNSYFLRRFRAGARPFPENQKVLGSPAESYVLAKAKWESESPYPIKEAFLRPEDLLGRHSASFRDGPSLVLRLSPSEYHRFHSPDTAVLETIEAHDGPLYSVNPVSLRHDPRVLIRNKRLLFILRTEKFGRLALIAVGATCVGRMKAFAHEGDPLERGMELGSFAIGGSTVVLLGEPGAWRPDADLLEQTRQGFECFARLGESIASGDNGPDGKATPGA